MVKSVVRNDFMGISKQIPRLTPTENWRVKTRPAESRPLPPIELLRRVGLRGVGANEMAGAVKVIRCPARPPTQRHQKIGRGQPVNGCRRHRSIRTRTPKWEKGSL